jgi:uncharacterized cupin superfamily protein
MLIDPSQIPSQTGSTYPAPFQTVVAGRSRKRLGNAAGLTQFGVNQVTLAPGAASALRHWHSHEDEFIYLLSGELILRSGAGEQPLTAGMAAGFPAGEADGHQLINRSDQPAIYLEVGTRNPSQDRAVYPDDDLLVEPGRLFCHRDGSPYPA